MPTSHVLFDFFGTLVGYSGRPARPVPHRTHALAREFGAEVGLGEFTAGWSAVRAEFKARCDVDDSEYATVDAAAEYLTNRLGLRSTRAEAEAFADCLLDEWASDLVWFDGLAQLLRTLRADHRLAVVSNTHSSTLVPRCLRNLGVADLFDVVVLSVDVGWRKPHPRIYAAALAELGAEPADAVFVGDTHLADFLGPERAGIRSYLIDPRGEAPIPDDRRLSTVFDLPDALARHAAGPGPA
ncbi:HAD family hydrolase [Longispora urticae]